MRGGQQSIKVEPDRPLTYPGLAEVMSCGPTVLRTASLSASGVLGARQLPNIRINAADPGMTATDLSRGKGHSVHDETDAIVAFAIDEADNATGTFRDRDGDLPW